MNLFLYFFPFNLATRAKYNKPRTTVSVGC